RAGVLEQSSVDLMGEIGVSARMDTEGLPHDGVEIGFDGEMLRIDFHELVGRRVMVYGQTELTRDLMDARQKSGAVSIYEAQDVAVHDFDGSTPRVTYKKDGQSHEI